MVVGLFLLFQYFECVVYSHYVIWLIMDKIFYTQFWVINQCRRITMQKFAWKFRHLASVHERNRHTTGRTVMTAVEGDTNVLKTIVQFCTIMPYQKRAEWQSYKLMSVIIYAALFPQGAALGVAPRSSVHPSVRPILSVRLSDSCLQFLPRDAL